MDLILKRNDYRKDGIFGKFLDEQDRFVCVTLEHAFSAGRGGLAPAIPPGQYVCKRRWSPKFKYQLFEVTNVPGHTDIEIHIGNKNEDSTGCILVGCFRADSVIMNSAKAFHKFMDLQGGLDAFKLSVVA